MPDTKPSNAPGWPARQLLRLLIGCGWLLTKIGKGSFEMGADLETWARGKLGE